MIKGLHCTIKRLHCTIYNWHSIIKGLHFPIYLRHRMMKGLHCTIYHWHSIINPLVPKHRMHYQKTFIFPPDTSFGKSNRKQGLNLCCGQRLPRLACSIYATLGIKFSRHDFLKVNNSRSNYNFRKLFWIKIWCKKKNLLDYVYHVYLKRWSQYLNSYFSFFNAQCIIYDTFSFLNFCELWWLIKPISDNWSQLKLFILVA